MQKIQTDIYESPVTLSAKSKSLIYNIVAQFQMAAFRCFISKSTIDEWVTFILNPICIYKYIQGQIDFKLAHFAFKKGINSQEKKKWETSEEWVKHHDINEKN